MYKILKIQYSFFNHVNKNINLNKHLFCTTLHFYEHARRDGIKIFVFQSPLNYAAFYKFLRDMSI